MELLQEYIPNILALLVCLCYLFYTNKIVGAAVLFGIVVFIIIIGATIQKSVEYSREEHAAFQFSEEHIQDRLQNLFDIYTSGTENLEKVEYSDLETDLKKSMIESFQFVTVITSVVEIITIIILVISLYTLYKSRGQMTTENIISTILVLTYFLGYFSKISGNYIGLTDGVGYSLESDRFLREISNPITTPEPSLGPSLGPSVGPQGALSQGPRGGSITGPPGVEFRNVSFKYPLGEGRKILNGVNLYIKPRSKVAIFGKSGSGKSTIAKLLLGFYGPESGEIIVGGTSIKDLGIQEFRRNIAVVNQNIKLFDKTIMENMLYGSSYGPEEVMNVLGSRLDIFGGDLEKNVGVGGSKLSGGQKQVVSFVRAILKNSGIIILDEVTSGLDPGTKKVVLDLIKSLKNKTVIIISHDKLILDYVDKAYQIQNGKLKMM